MTVLNNAQATIDTTVPTLTIGQIQLSADRRSTKEKPLTDAERIRRVVLPANQWGELQSTINGAASQSLTDVLREALKGIASERLRDTLTEAPMLRVVNLDDYTVPALLKWNAETASSRGSITFTRDQATDWFAKSATAAAMMQKHGAKGLAVVGMLTNRFGALAAKNHGLKDVAEAVKLASIIDAKDLDADSPTAALVVEIVARIEHIIKALTAKANEATVSMDDI